MRILKKRPSKSILQTFRNPVIQHVNLIFVCMHMVSHFDNKCAYKSSFQASGTPGKHQWLQSWGAEGGVPCSLWLEGCPSLLSSVRYVILRNCGLNCAVFVCLINSEITSLFNGSAFSSVTSFSGVTYVEHCPPSFHAPSLQFFTSYNAIIVQYFRTSKISLILLYKKVKSFLSFPNPHLSQFKVEGPYYFHNVVLQESVINYVMQL